MMEMIDLLNAAKDKVDAEDMDRAMANEDTNKKLRELIVAANEEMRTKLTDKTTLSGLGDLAAELGAGEDLIAAASAGKDKKDKKMKRLQDVIIVQWEVNRVNTTHAGSGRDGGEVDMQDDDDEDQEDEVNQDSPTEEKVTEHRGRHVMLRGLAPLAGMSTDEDLSEGSARRWTSTYRRWLAG